MRRSIALISSFQRSRLPLSLVRKLRSGWSDRVMDGCRSRSISPIRKAQSAPELDEASVQIKKLQPERVEALGKTILCDVYQLQVRQIEGDAQIKMWTNSQVPGTVKTQISVKSAAMNLSRELVVDQVEAK